MHLSGMQWNDEIQQIQIRKWESLSQHAGFGWGKANFLHVACMMLCFVFVMKGSVDNTMIF